MLHSPFEQFRTHGIFFYNNIIISNTILLLCTIIISVSLIFYWIFSFQKSNKKSIQLAGQLYNFLYTTIKGYLGNSTNFYFPFLFFIFAFIIFCNLVGLLPYSFTLTSQLYTTLFLALIAWLGVLYIGITNWGIKLFALFFPHGVATALVFFLSLIETISFIFRVFSLALRLFANMVAGHILLDCIIFFIYKQLYQSFFVSSFNIIGLFAIIIPFIFLIVLFLFECCVAFLQGYIFIILTCIYLKEIL